jgi:hypothetical protein
MLIVNALLESSLTFSAACLVPVTPTTGLDTYSYYYLSSCQDVSPNVRDATVTFQLFFVNS